MKMATIISLSQLPSPFSSLPPPSSSSAPSALLMKTALCFAFCLFQIEALSLPGTQNSQQQQQLRGPLSAVSQLSSNYKHEQTPKSSSLSSLSSPSSSSSLSSSAAVSALNVIPPPILALPSEPIVHNVSAPSSSFIDAPPPPFPPPPPSPPIQSPRSSLQEKLHSASQSLNDLFSDLLVKPLQGLSSSSSNSNSNSSTPLLSNLEHLLAEKVKLPRPLNALISSLSAHSHSHSSNHINHNNSLQFSNEDSANELGEALPFRSSSSSSVSSQKPNKKKITGNAGATGNGGRCYEPYGCYRVNEPPFRSIYRPINLLPEPPAAIRVAFSLRTRANPSVAERLSYSESVRFLKSAYFHPAARLKIIIHGYLESGDESWIRELSAALLNREEEKVQEQFNVISVDWGLGASPPYTQAVANTRLVGAIIAHLIRVIQDTYPDRFPASSIHLIGHSLGAHIAGYTGSLVPVGQITGLDPAEPYFQYTDPLVRLDPGDADFVDVIHTDGASIISGGFGMNQSVGHVDFFPNGGVTQPGCKEAPIKNVWDSISKERTVFDGIRRFIGCNHLRAFLLYIETINSECPFTAYPCASYEDFTSGQCTDQLLEAQYDTLCYSNSNLQQNTANLTACPIRMGLDSLTDFRRQLGRLHPSQAYYHHFHHFHPHLSSSSNQAVSYFLQTSDRPPFCQYHYDLKVVLRVSQLQQRMMQRSSGGFLSSRSSSSSSSHLYNDNSVLLSGRLQVTVVGSRGRTVTEVSFNKQANSAADHNENGGSQGGNDNTERMSGGHSYHHLKEVNILFSDADLGTVLRLELEWRPFSTSSPLSPFTSPVVSSLSPRPQLILANLQQIQSRALRRWLPQSMALSATNQLAESLGSSGNGGGGLLNELQRTLVSSGLINATSLQATTSQLLSAWTSGGGGGGSGQSAHLSESNHHGKSLSSSEAAAAPSFQNAGEAAPPVITSKTKSKTLAETPPLTSTTTYSSLPLLEALVLTKLETGEQQVFCTSEEPSLRMLFQQQHQHQHHQLHQQTEAKRANGGHSPQSIPRTAILIRGKSVKRKTSDNDHYHYHHNQQLRGEALILQLCTRDINY